MQFQLDGCIMRGWRSGDEPSLARHANDREIWLNLRDRFPHPYSLADAEEWVRFASTQQPRVNFAIEVAGEAVGGISLMLQEDVERVSAEVGYWLGRSFWGRGIGTSALRAVTAHGMTTFGLTRIYALPYARNLSSLRVLEKAGYRREGVLRRSALKDGIVLDQVLYAFTDLDVRDRT
jgi:[ribosomal protein S5]-alanine N-acetyltransferase